ncbi:hypothetical protein CHX26_02305 [Porphyrobacter sp. HT-58-2]|uniref:GIN domain-containing protein n=1 Tax=Porphyrobacter sp. HT-58-2 TaxID=2023229 RepID=UPI000CDCDF7D|nr:DUF2807 domain-containing protein [Porphyrobacter sp. HT-58-2]AUX68500.1 hypothetical protein CHX26_02305 [Porphyrobacter sp. HT-58-2]
MSKPVVLSLAAFASAVMLTGCDGADIEINGQKGVPLAEIELAGPPPAKVFLASGDTVILTEGDSFAIKVEGSGTESLRFVRDAELIGITREDGWKGGGSATIRITMPAPSEVVIGGSGTIKAPTLASDAAINIGGAGTVEFGTIAAEKLAINIGGSGKVKGSGTARELEVLIGGSGDVVAPGLKVDVADITIGGAGDVAFASDGTVEASIAGAGDVTVTGMAKCTVSAMGSGTLNCAPASGTGATTEIPSSEAKSAE